MKTSMLLAALSIMTATTARADDLHADVEVDPTAYALDGFSIHVGVGTGRWRVDVGNFALHLPQVFHGNDGFDVSFDGYGAKLQMFLRDDRTGWFGGVDVGAMRLFAQRQGTDLARRHTQVAAGIAAGYRIALPHDFYATPWLGVGYAFGGSDITLDGATYHPTKITVFPAVHVGFRFR